MNQVSTENITKINPQRKKSSFLSDVKSSDESKSKGISLMLRFAIFESFSFLVLIVLFSFWDMPLETLIAPFGGIVVTLTAIYFIYSGRLTRAKYILSIIPPYLYTISSALAKANGFSANALMYLVPNLLIVLLAIIPVILFGYFNRKKLFISFVFLSPVWFLFKPIHEFFGVNFLDLPYLPKYFINILILFSVFFLLIFYSIMMLQRINYKVRIKLKKNLDLVENEKRTIQSLNEDLTLQSNLYEILNLMSDTRDLKYILNEVLVQILKVKKLHLLDKGLIFLKNKNGTLNIVAQRNVEILLETCSEVRQNECLCGKALVSKKSMFCNNVNHHHDIRPPGMKPHGHYVEPILGKNGAVLGIINVYISPGQEKDESITEYLTAVANILSVKISNIRYNQNLLKQKNQIEVQKNIIDETYNSIMESLEYAQSLQKVLLPTKKELEKSFVDHFVLFLPKDKVSGDFYFAEKFNNKISFGVGDCTGHGVPGAFLASNAIENMKKVLFYNQEAKPNVILEVVRSFNEQKFEKSRESNHHDSMDAALCEYHSDEKKLYYSGGFVDLIIIRNGEILIRKANRNPIGVYPKKEIFELHAIAMEKDDIVYLFSDGIYDQFGPVKGKNKKLKRKIFHNWLLEVKDYPLSKQKQILHDKFMSWKQDVNQTDDVTVFAVKVL